MGTTRLRQLHSCNLDVSNEVWVPQINGSTCCSSGELPTEITTYQHSSEVQFVFFRLVKGDRSKWQCMWHVLLHVSATLPFISVIKDQLGKPSHLREVDALDSQQVNLCPGCRCGNNRQKCHRDLSSFGDDFCCWSSSERHRLVWKRECMLVSIEIINHQSWTFKHISYAWFSNWTSGIHWTFPRKNSKRPNNHSVLRCGSGEGVRRSRNFEISLQRCESGTSKSQVF